MLGPKVSTATSAESFTLRGVSSEQREGSRPEPRHKSSDGGVLLHEGLLETIEVRRAVLFI